ncbi:alanine--tRNA ligase [Helicobacter sp. 11S02629-2]|uniref:alanine--tRNA ligase n=1 Tax=Helicobacter sp. 11S02629-2 TaxID=1476195 RepID=UPI000BA5D2BF|nr:alanine--tRNA ligase [Helicobacter sp. 11S02629-2]PAF44931.1 alanine--tRNA ligase [Helicobacter sp. 11S02629-2]
MEQKLDIRGSFLEFFKSKGHQIYDSMPLVPNDPTLLFTNAGMVQFKDIFTGTLPPPKGLRATSSQVCLRAGGKHNDLENVGYTARHHTMFEMLGNFSFGDYFKKDAIKYAWEFVTEVLKLPKEKLYITVHESDDEAYNLWKEIVPISHIKRLGDKDNFWQMGDTGPCGPCSEIFIDQGEEHFSGSEDYFGGDGDRFLEIWNLVFMQFEKSKDGKLTPLPKPSIDTGMGLERVQAVMEGKTSNFDSSIFTPLIKEVEKLCNKPYKYETGASYRVIADHARAVCFLLAQGVTFDKEGRGYVLRRILRRALRHGYLLGIKGAFLYKVVDKVIDELSYHYSYLKEKRENILELCKLEELRFLDTLESGMKLFKEELSACEAKGEKIFSGEVAFKLYDTFGFPLDLTLDMLKDTILSLDIASFEACMETQKARSSASWKGSGDEGVNENFKHLVQSLLSKFGKNEFVGYEYASLESKILSLLDSEFNEVSTLKEGQKGYVLFAKTPLYPQGGGPLGEAGKLYKDTKLVAEVLDTKKYHDLIISSILSKDTLNVNETIKIEVSNDRFEIKKHHSATHLLHAVLHEVLGSSIAQAGSLVLKDRLRFDFTYHKALDSTSLDLIESKVNALIASALSTKVEHLSKEDAIAKGAKALFNEKYGDTVRVVSFGSESIELCGGLHVNNTAEINSFYITKEGSVSSGVRRIEAVCGLSAYEYASTHIRGLKNLENTLKTKDILGLVAKLKSTLKADSSIQEASFKAELINNVPCVISLASGNLKAHIDNFKNANVKCAIFLLQASDDKASLVLGSKGVELDCNMWLKSMSTLGLKGGGRKDFLQAGLKLEEGKSLDSKLVDEILSKAKAYLESNLKG